MRTRPAHWFPLALFAAALAADAPARAADATALAPKKGDRIILIGNTLAERMQYFGNWETLLQSRFPDLNLIVHNLGWSADELTLRPRSKSFEDHGHTLKDEQPNIVIAAFGLNESFGGAPGLTKFKGDLETFIQKTTTTKFNGKSAPTLVLLSPIAHENLHDPNVPDGAANNANIALYTKAMAELAAKHKVVFVDLFTPTERRNQLQAAGAAPRSTINGIHLNEFGDGVVARLLDETLFGPRPSGVKADLAKLKAEVNEKNKQFWYDYRAINGCYIYGGRKGPFGVVNFPAEFAKLRAMIQKREERVWAVAQGQPVPATIDDSDTGALVRVETNVKGPIKITTPAEEQATFTLPAGYKINLFASEEQFPDLKKPVQMAFDAKGRLWVTTMPSYPMYLPGRPVNDKVLIFEDADGDGAADTQKVFADGLHVPTGIELGDGGVYVSQQPNLMFMKDTDGDDVADSRTTIMHGFDTADSHHALHAFTWDPGGALYWNEGTFHYSQVETPYGPRRCNEAGVFRFEPKTLKFDVFISYPFANPWGQYFDRWGQNLVADASGGANYFGTAFSGQVDYPAKHGRMNEFLVKQWRPTCGCELVASRHFPDDAQGDYLLNNDIGFQGVLRYRMKEDGSGFKADPVEPLLKSSDPNFRPVALQFGPDGALYVVDWFNPLVGHMQHSLRDPNRDVQHGRIWRITYPSRPLVPKPKIAGASNAELLDLLKVYEDRTRYRARRELHDRPTAAMMASLTSWLDSQSKTDRDYWRLMLEGLWLKQSHNVVDESLLKTMLNCPEPKARAAATRVLGYWRDRVSQPLEQLRKQVNDDHPRVRLEALRALSYFDGKDVPAAQEVALEALALPQDYYLEYTLNETTKTLDGRAGKPGAKEKLVPPGR